MSLEIEKIEVDICFFEQWLEKQLSQIYQYDLVNVFEGYKALKMNINNLLSVSVTCRRSAGLLNATQSARAIKICDQIDALLSIETGYTLHDNCFITNSDIEFLKTLKNKLKIIEDMASSGKLTKSSGFEATGKDLRSLLRQVLDCVDHLEFSLQQQSKLISHFSYIREVVHRPVSHFMTQLMRLIISGTGAAMPAAYTTICSSKGSSSSITVGLEMKKQKILEMQRLEEEIIALKRSPILQTIAELKKDLNTMSDSIQSQLQPIRIVSNVLLGNNSLTMPPRNFKSENLDKFVRYLETPPDQLIQLTRQEIDCLGNFRVGIQTLQQLLINSSHKLISTLSEYDKQTVQSFDFEYFEAFMLDSSDVQQQLSVALSSEEMNSLLKDLRVLTKSLDHLRMVYANDKLYLKDLQNQFILLKEVAREVCAMEIKVIVDLLEPVELGKLIQLYRL